MTSKITSGWETQWYCKSPKLEVSQNSSFKILKCSKTLIASTMPFIMITMRRPIDCAQNLTISFISNYLKKEKNNPFQCQELLDYLDTKKLEDWPFLTKPKWIMKPFGVSHLLLKHPGMRKPKKDQTTGEEI